MHYFTEISFLECIISHGIAVLECIISHGIAVLECIILQLDILDYEILPKHPLQKYEFLLIPSELCRLLY